MEVWREELYHHGIKGQRWGVRRFQEENGTLTPAGKRRYLTDTGTKGSGGGGGGATDELTEEQKKELLKDKPEGWSDESWIQFKTKASADIRSNADIKATPEEIAAARRALAKDPEEEDLSFLLDDKKAHKEEEKKEEEEQPEEEEPQEEDKEKSKGKKGSGGGKKGSGGGKGSGKAAAKEKAPARNPYERFGARIEEGPDERQYYWNRNDYIDYARKLSKKQFKRKAMKHSDGSEVIGLDESWRSELYHHGIKGQRWGVRRFQNPDGSLTARGKKRYDRLEEKMHRLDPSGEFKAREQVSKERGFDNTARYKHDDYKYLTNKELADRNTRLGLEKKYKEYVPEKKSLGRKFLDEIVIPGLKDVAKSSFKSLATQAVNPFISALGNSISSSVSKKVNNNDNNNNNSDNNNNSNKKNKKNNNNNNNNNNSNNSPSATVDINIHDYTTKTLNNERHETSADEEKKKKG